MGWVTHFGGDAWSFNLESYEPDEDGESDGSGMPGAGIVGSAIFAWLGLQGRPQTVSVIAETFALTAELVRDAVRFHDDMVISGPTVTRPFGRRLACFDHERTHDRWDPDLDLSAAISVWASLRGKNPTVSDAVMAFMITSQRVEQAVEEHCWMYIGPGNVIEHDGE